MEIRPLEKSEIAALLELWKAADSHPSVTDNVADISRVLEREYATVLVAESESNLIGSIIATFDGWRGIVYRLAVHPNYRRHGIARELTAKAEEQFRQWDVRRVIAIVDVTKPYAM